VNSVPRAILTLGWSLDIGLRLMKTPNISEIFLKYQQIYFRQSCHSEVLSPTSCSTAYWIHNSKHDSILLTSRQKEMKLERRHREKRGTHIQGGRQIRVESNHTNELTTTQVWTDREMGKWTYTQMDRYID